MDKLISIQKQMDTNQTKGKYSLSNYKENNNTDNKNKNKINANNNNMNYFNNSRKNKDILNLDESEESEENSNNNDHSSQKGNKYKQKTTNTNKEYYTQNKNNISQEPPSQKKEKGCELFIGNLNITTEKEDLNTLFSPYGEISDIRIHKNEENKKCYAFVRFSSKESANLALKLDSTLLNNRHIKVTKSNENATIFIGNIRKTWTKEELETKIRRIFHNINKIEFFTDPGNPGKNRGFCFGIFNTRNEAIKALNYVNKKGGINIDGISITCDWADVVDDDDNSKSDQIFISNIKKEVSEYDLKKYFEKFEKVISVIMSKNHFNSKRKDLAFITFESHEKAVSAIQKFEEEKKNPKMENYLKKIFYLGENESVNLIQVSLAFSQEAMQNKKKIKDNRKKIPPQNQKGNNTNNSDSNNSNNNNHRGNLNNNNNNNNNSNNKNSGKTFMGNISMNAQNEYKNYSSGHRSKNYQRHERGRSHNYLGGNKNVHDLFSSLNNNNKNIYGNNQLNNYQGNKNNNVNLNNNLYSQLNQLYTNSIENKAGNTYMNNNNNNSNNNNLNQNQLTALSSILNLCQQNPSLLQQMTNNLNKLYSGNLMGNTNDLSDINNDKKFLNRKRNNNNNNYFDNNLNNDNMNNNNLNELQNNTYLNQTQNQNIIPQFPYIPSISQINTPNVSTIQNLQNIIPTIQNNIPNNPNFN
jgi:RNA recognition motif-containing protein